MPNAHILQIKSQNHASTTSLEFRKKVISQLVEGKSFRKDTGLVQAPVVIPDIRFDRDHFHHLISNDTRSTCKVHIQTIYHLQLCHLWCQNVC